MAKYLTAKNLCLLYNIGGMLPFGLMSADMVTEVWPSISRETCTKGGWGSKGRCEDSLEFTVGKIYLQVMFGMSPGFRARTGPHGKHDTPYVSVSLLGVKLHNRFVLEID